MIRRRYHRFRGTPWYRKKKKVLVLEGGGMRGIFLTGVLQSFTDRGYFPWRLIIGSSAGALTGTAYAARQIHLARAAVFTELRAGQVIKLRNLRAFPLLPWAHHRHRLPPGQPAPDAVSQLAQRPRRDRPQGDRGHSRAVPRFRGVRPPSFS
jgi:predicted acylesterase/phospholipase RssA